MGKTTEKFKLSEPQNTIFFSGDATKRFGIFPKGRRLGATRGGTFAFTKWMLEGHACLWGDTINSNIDRYVDRYFKPFLKANGIAYNWSSQKKLMQVGDGYTDFRSADRPENWEGFGYSRVFLNEAGIILNDEYLYYNAVLPMLMDFPDSQLIAAGTPKLLRGKGRLFYELYQRVERGEEGFYGKTFSTYDSPFLTRKQVHDLEMKIPANERGQEIHGKFLTDGGAIILLSWFQRYRSQPAFPTRIIQSWDTASKAQEINDPSVCTTWLETPGNYYLIDVFKEWLEYPGLKRCVKSLAMKYVPDAILVEDKSSGMALLQDLRADTEFHYNLVAITPVQDKVTRLSTASLTVEAGRVHLPEVASWLVEYEVELSAFPNVEHDDQSDSTSQFLNWVKAPMEIMIG